MEIRKDEQEYSLPKTFNKPITFLHNQKQYQVFEYIEGDSSKKGFFNLLFNSEKISLLLKEKIILIPEIKAKTGYDKYQPPTLSRSKDKLYIGYKNNTTSELPSRKKDFFKVFSSNSKVIEEYAKKNKLGIKDKNDLIKIFEYYNSIN